MEENKITIPSALDITPSENKVNVPSALNTSSNDGVSLAAECGFMESVVCALVCQTAAEADDPCQITSEATDCIVACEVGQDCSEGSGDDCYNYYENCGWLSENCGNSEINPCDIDCQNNNQDCGSSQNVSKPSVGTGIWASNITSTTAYITFNSIDRAVKYRIAYRKSDVQVATTFIVDSSGFYLEGLTPNTEYVINYEGIDSSGVAGGYMSDGHRFTTLPLYWSWDYSNGIASDLQTQLAYEAVTNNGLLTDFSYLVWNDMCNFILTVMQSQGHSWISNQYGLTFNETLMTSSDKEMTAARFNSLRYNVGRIYSTGISEVSKGDIIYGSYFTQLMSRVNSWIEEFS